MNVTFTVTKRRRPHQKRRPCLSDAASCKSGPLRWMLCPLWCWWKVFFFSFSCLFFCLQFHYLSAPGRVAAHLTAIGPNYEKICRQSVSHIIIFHPSQSDRKNSWRAWIVLRIPFQPLCYSGPSSLFGSDRSKITGLFSQLQTTKSEAWEKNIQDYTSVNFFLHSPYVCVCVCTYVYVYIYIYACTVYTWPLHQQISNNNNYL